MKKVRIMSGIIIMIMAFSMIFVPSVSADGWEYSPIKANISIENNGVYSSDELDTITFDVCNSSSLVRTFNEKITLKDAYNNVLWSSDKERKLAPNTNEETPIHMIEFSLGDYLLSYVVSVRGVDCTEEIKFYCSGDTLVLKNQGINEHFTGSISYTDRDISNMKNGGYSIFRSTIPWSSVEKEKGVYTLPEFYIDRIDKIKENGIEALIVLSGNNSLYGKNEFPKTNDEVEGFANFCSYVAGELKGRVKYYEMFNEPNALHNIWGENYVKLIKAAYPAIKAADPEAYVLGVSQAGIWWPTTCEATFMKQVFEAGGADYMDAVSVHPYPDMSKKAVDEHPVSYKAVMDCIIDAMCGAKLPIWITETGYSSVANEYGSISDDEQAAYEARLSVLFDEDGRADMMMKYQLRDLQENPEKDWDQAHFGLTFNNGTPKPNYRTVTAKNKLTYNMKFSGKDVNMDSSKKGYSVYSYASTGKKLYVLWSNGGNEYTLSLSKGSAEYSSSVSDDTLNINLPVGEDEDITVRDAFGNTITDTYNLKLDFWPKYIICGEAEEGPDSLYVSTVGNTVSISGKSVKANQNVTVKISDPGEIDLPGGYVNQCKSDSQRNFSFTTELESGTYLVRVNNGNVREREITIKGQTPAETGEMNISVSGNMAEISGKSVKPNQNVTVRISRKGSDEPSFVYVNQYVSGDDRSFSFTAELEKGEYTAFVNNGNTENTDFEIKNGILLKKNGMTANSLGDVQPTDKLEAEFYLENVGEPLYAIAALYKDDRVVWAQREEVKPNSSEVNTNKLTIPAFAGIGAEKLVCFVWNGDLKPCLGVKQFN